MSPISSPAVPVAAAFTRQAELCAKFDSPLYADLCRRAADDARSGGPVLELVRELAAESPCSALPLRVLAGVHALALDGTAPELAHRFAAATDVTGWPRTWRCWHHTLAAHAERIRPWLASPPQTNEVGRSSALLGGFLVAAGSGLPLRMLELGASAGLNLRWDRYRFTTRTWTFGPDDASVVLRPRWQGEAPPLRMVPIVEGLGCDVAPLDPRDPKTQLRLCAYVWADRHDRLRTVRRALAEAQRDDDVVDRADAAEWLPAKLQAVRTDLATVVYHSSFWGHLPPATQQRLTSCLSEAGGRATEAAPLFWLRWEDEPTDSDAPPERHELRLTRWPGGTDRLLAVGQPHGDWVEWLDG